MSPERSEGRLGLPVDECRRRRLASDLPADTSQKPWSLQSPTHTWPSLHRVTLSGTRLLPGTCRERCGLWLCDRYSMVAGGPGGVSTRTGRVTHLTGVTRSVGAPAGRNRGSTTGANPRRRLRQFRLATRREFRP